MWFGASRSFPRDFSRATERKEWTMISFAQPVEDEDIYISEELIGRLHRATEDSVLEVVANLRANQRASLAMHCYRKSHLHQTGLTIASTCDLGSLVQVCGPIRGKAIFAQSRRGSMEPRRLWGRARPMVTLASSAGGSYPLPGDLDIVDLGDGPSREQAVGDGGHRQ
jgi:hypothetical protein